MSRRSKQNKRDHTQGGTGHSPVPAQNSPPTASSGVQWTMPEYEVYAEQRKILWAAEIDTAKTFDQWLITVAGGALALSMTILKDIVSPRSPEYPSLLVGSWIAFGLAVACTLWSILWSQRGYEKFKEDWDEAFKEKKPDPISRVNQLQSARTEFRWIPRLNRASIILFFLGLALLGAFAWLNLAQKEIQHGEASKPQERRAVDENTGERTTSQRAGPAAEHSGTGRSESTPAAPAERSASQTDKKGVTTMSDQPVPPPSTTKRIMEGAKPISAPVPPPVPAPPTSGVGKGAAPPQAPAPPPSGTQPPSP